jgi:hypothetical protein
VHTAALIKKQPNRRRKTDEQDANTTDEDEMMLDDLGSDHELLPPSMFGVNQHLSKDDHDAHSPPASVAAIPPEQLPRDAKIVMSLLENMGVTDYEPQIVNQLLEFVNGRSGSER